MNLWPFTGGRDGSVPRNCREALLLVRLRHGEGTTCISNAAQATMTCGWWAYFRSGGSSTAMAMTRGGTPTPMAITTKDPSTRQLLQRREQGSAGEDNGEETRAEASAARASG